MFTLAGEASAGIMAIANVCQVCGWLHGVGTTVMTPLVSTIPSQHSGVVTHLALAPFTPAAGQCFVVVATPTPPTPPGRAALGELAPAGPLPAEPLEGPPLG